MKKKEKKIKIAIPRVAWIDNLRFDLQDVEIVGIEHSEAIVYRMKSGTSIAFTWNEQLAKDLVEQGKITIVSLIGIDDFKKIMDWILTLKEHEPVIVA